MSRHTRQLNRRQRRAANRIDNAAQTNAARTERAREHSYQVHSAQRAQARADHTPTEASEPVRKLEPATIAVSPAELQAAATAGRFCIQISHNGGPFLLAECDHQFADKAKDLYDTACNLARLYSGARVRVIRPEPGSRAVYRLQRKYDKSGLAYMGTYST